MLSIFRTSKPDPNEDRIKEIAESIKSDVFSVLDANETIVSHGYLITFKKVAHLLPSEAKFTLLGMEAVNLLLRESNVTKEYMKLPVWERDISTHRDAVQKDEDAKIARAEAREQANRDAMAFVVEEIETLRKREDPILKNYGKLINFLRRGMRRGYRGHRGVCIIHEAMLKLILWAPHWTEYMAETEAEAQRRDNEYVASLRARRDGTKK
jgi:hypothetical protein